MICQLKAFDDAFETIYDNNDVNIVHVQQISEELQTNCLHLINKMVKNKNDSSKNLCINEDRYIILGYKVDRFR